MQQEKQREKVIIGIIIFDSPSHFKEHTQKKVSTNWNSEINFSLIWPVGVLLSRAILLSLTLKKIYKKVEGTPGAQVERLANCRENCQSWTDCFSPCFWSREKKKFHALCQRKSAKHQISTNPFFKNLKSSTYYVVIIWSYSSKIKNNTSCYS